MITNLCSWTKTVYALATVMFLNLFCETEKKCLPRMQPYAEFSWFFELFQKETSNDSHWALTLFHSPLKSDLF